MNERSINTAGDAILKMLRRILPVFVKHHLKQVFLPSKLGSFLEEISIEYHSQYTNIYHCCVQKTASQWFMKILLNPEIFRYSGLKDWHHKNGGYLDERPLNQRFYENAFPEETIVTPLYIGYDAFMALPKPENYRAFFVMRDPRDIVVSWYFSARNSHPIIGDLGEVRAHLQTVQQDEGLRYAIDYLQRSELFAALDSWTRSADNDAVRLIRFESITGQYQKAQFHDLLDFCDIRVPQKILNQLLENNSFAKLSRGRHQGQEDKKSHYRKGQAGDWQNYFSSEVYAYFIEVTGDLFKRLGYD